MMRNVNELMEEVASELTRREIQLDSVKCIGITNQRESSIAWCSQTHEPLYNCISWLDQREYESLNHISNESSISISVSFGV